MWSPKSVNKIFPSQQNTNQNFWSPPACRQNQICNRCHQESNQCSRHLLTTLTDLHFHLLTPREYLNLQVISLRMFRLHFVINYRKISEHLWTPHHLDNIHVERTHGACCARNTYVMGNRWKTWRHSFALIVAVKRCGRFIITGKSVLYFKSSGKVKSKWPIDGWLWILF